MGWYPCCCEGECQYCSTIPPDPLAITIADMAGDECTYTWMNFTFSVAYSFGSKCVRLAASVNKCNFLDANNIVWSLSAEALLLVSGNTGWRVILAMNKAENVQTITWEWDSGGTAAFDCSAERSLTLVSDVGANHYDPSSSSCIVN